MVITGVTCEEEEGFVLTNTSDCEGATGNVAVPQDPEPCGDCKLNGVQFAPGEGVSIEVSDTVSIGEKSSVDLGYYPAGALVTILRMIFDDNRDLDYLKFLVAVLGGLKVVTNINPDLYDSYLNSSESSYHIGFILQSGGGRFETVLEDMALDIETNTAKVSSVAQNDFAVGHNPDTTLTVAACYEGSVTVDPTNPALSSVALLKGQQVRVWSDRIGPVTRIPQTNILPALMLLKEE